MYLPVALHRNVIFAPSRTMTSLELNESSIFGGTAKTKAKKRNSFLMGKLERSMLQRYCNGSLIIIMNEILQGLLRIHLKNYKIMILNKE